MEGDAPMGEDDGPIPGELSGPSPLRHPWRDHYGFLLNLTKDEETAYEQANANVLRAELDWKSMQDAVVGKPWFSKELTRAYASPNSMSRSPLVLASDDLRNLLKSEGIPPNRRQKVWMGLSGASSLKLHCAPGYYTQLRQMPCSDTDKGDIEKDLHRTCASHPWFETDEARILLRSVLSAYATRNPEVGYSQGLNSIVGMLLLVTHADEEATFWLLAALVEKILPKGMYNRNLDFAKGLMYKFEKLMYQACPELQMHLLAAVQYECAMTVYRWVYSLCSGEDFPAETTFRIWDLLFTGFGPSAEILLLVPLAVFRINEEKLLQLYEDNKVHAMIQQSALRLTDANLLVRLISDGLNMVCPPSTM
ncbi:hypothetical protein GOP47_0025136 [Adiantum capillus-veneris]|uniref:Rab-GAP TBC domain-containing protein n=1 Tax=Adiantum capillus-veneris TaxID=13818 RepID=A0A9D4Z5P5_ADICA|nr:hypothetical protein GOP47_0025136 [Adiantum capillus-veneris]